MSNVTIERTIRKFNFYIRNKIHYNLKCPSKHQDLAIFTAPRPNPLYRQVGFNFKIHVQGRSRDRDNGQIHCDKV